jgi:hypothetical protein
MPTVDLRFVVHNRKDIDLATKSLVAFNKVSVHRQSNYDAEAAAAKRGMTATERLIRLEDKLIKQRLRDNLVGEARTQQIQAHERILQQEIRTLQDYIDTDKVLEKEQKAAIRTEANLAKQREKTKNDTEKLRKTYDSTYAATKRYKQGLKDIDRAFEGMEDGPERASRAIKALKSDYQAFIAASKSGQLVDAGNQFARYGDQAYRAQQRTKRFASVGLQQAGYQVNDFIVQIASGQNALVAFGQQGSQLAGIFGTKGAVVGAVIAGVAALGNLAYQAYMAQEGIKTLEDALSDLGDALGMVADAEQTLEDLASGDYLGHMADEADRLADSLRALGLAKGLAEVVSGMKAVTDTDMGFMDEFIAGSIEKSKDLIPFYRMFATDFYRETKTLTEKMQDDQAQNMAASLFGKDSGKVGFTEAFLQDLRKLQEAKASAEEVAKRISRFTKQAEIWGFDDATTEGKALFEEIIRLGDGARKLAEAQADSVRQEKDRRQAVDESATEMEAFYKQIEKEDKEYWKRYYKNYKLQQKQQADRLKAGIAAAKKIVDAQEKAAEGGARVQLKYENAVAAARAKLKKAEGDDATAQRREKALAAKVAEEQVRAQYESLRLKSGQLQLTAKQTTEMDNQIRLARAAATQAVVLKYEAEAAAEQIREQAKAATELANQIERAKRAYETFLTKGQSEEVKLAGLREKLRVLQEGGTSGEASAAERLQVQKDKITAEVNEQRRLQRALGNKRTETEAEITEAATKRLTTAQQTYDVELKIAKEQKSKTGGGKTPKSALEILLKEERSMKLKLDQREALIGLTDQEILLENTKYALMSKVQEQMATMSESDKAATLAKIEGIAQEMAAREEQIKLLQEQEAHQKNVADTIANNMGSALTSIVDGTKSVSDAFKDMARAIIAELYQIYVVKQITGMISAAIAPHVPQVPNANGNAFSGGNIVPYASGGVVSAPTMFPMSGGKTGLMGEAGPEAIMPLKRGKNGKLGVQADGGSGDVIIHQNFNFTANGDESVKKIIAQQAPAIANMTKKQILDDRRRGGQMKQAFG